MRTLPLLTTQAVATLSEPWEGDSVNIPLLDHTLFLLPVSPPSHTLIVDSPRQHMFITTEIYSKKYFSLIFSLITAVPHAALYFFYCTSALLSLFRNIVSTLAIYSVICPSLSCPSVSQFA